MRLAISLALVLLINGAAGARAGDDAAPKLVMDRDFAAWSEEALAGPRTRRLTALSVLPEFGAAAVEPLVTAAADEDAAVRYWALTGLRHVGNLPKSALATVTGSLADPSPIVHVAAAEALLGGPRAADAGKRLIELSGHDDFRIRLAVMWSLVRAGDDARVLWPDVEPCLGDENTYVRNVARQFQTALEPPQEATE